MTSRAFWYHLHQAHPRQELSWWTWPSSSDPAATDPSATPPALAPQARLCTCRCGPSAWPYDSWHLSPLRQRAFQIAAGKCSQLLRSLLIGLCAFLLEIILVLGGPTCFGHTTLRSWSLGTARFSFTALACSYFPFQELHVATCCHL